MTCQLCGKARRLYPLTRQITATGHRVALKACSDCCGPSLLPKDEARIAVFPLRPPRRAA